MNEEKVLLSTILRKYRVTAVETPETIAVTGEVIIRPLKGMLMKLQPRNS